MREDAKLPAAALGPIISRCMTTHRFRPPSKPKNCAKRFAITSICYFVLDAPEITDAEFDAR